MTTTQLSFSHNAGDYTLPAGPSVAVAAALVRRIGADADLWQDLVRYGEGDERWFERLFLDAEHDIWLIAWLPGQNTGLHDHGEALGAFTVVRGTLTETTVHPRRPRDLTEPVDVVRRQIHEGRVRGFGYEHIHDVGNVGTEPAVSIHAYAPELTAMTQYVLEDDRLRVVASERAGVNW